MRLRYISTDMVREILATPPNNKTLQTITRRQRFLLEFKFFTDKAHHVGKDQHDKE